jgi:hypothetical protein
MINILFYGNCQAYAVLKTLSLPSEYIIHNVQCWTGVVDKIKFTNTIKKCNIIITQPIKNNYRNVDYLSTDYIIKNASPKCKIIIFDSCYFDFYYPDLVCKQINGKSFDKPSVYQYNKMIESFKNNYTVDEYLAKYVNNVNLKSKDELENLANKSLRDLKERYNSNIKNYKKPNTHIISTHDYIKNNYKNKLLFYSMNHPTKYVIQNICEEITKFLKIKNTINYTVDELAVTKCILYKCIQKNVHFDINNHIPLVSNKTNVKEITQAYYNAFRSIALSHKNPILK